MRKRLILITIFCIGLPFFLRADRLLFSHNKPYYVSGEDIRFSINVVSSDYKVREIAKIFQISFLNTDGDVIHHQFFKTRKGVGNGTVTIPKTISSGVHQIQIHYFETKQLVSIIPIKVFALSESDSDKLKRIAQLNDFIVTKGNINDTSFKLDAFFIETNRTLGDKLVLTDDKNEVIETQEVFKPSDNLSFDSRLESNQTYYLSYYSNEELISVEAINSHFPASYLLAPFSSHTNIQIEEVNSVGYQAYSDNKAVFQFNKEDVKSISTYSISVFESGITRYLSRLDLQKKSIAMDPMIFMSNNFLVLTEQENFLSYEGLLIGENGEVIKNRIIGCTVFNDRQSIFKSILTDGDGYFDLGDLDFYGTARLKLSILGQLETMGIELKLKNSFLPVAFVKTDQRDNTFLRPIIARLLVKNSLKNVYETSFDLNELIVKKTIDQHVSTDQTLNYDKTFNLSEYDSFDSLEDVIKELIASVKVKKRKGERDLYVFSDKTRSNYPEPAKCIIDGVVYQDLETILSLDVKYISAIHIVNDPVNLYKIGPIAINGLLIIETKTDTDLNNSALYLETNIDGYIQDVQSEINENLYTTVNRDKPVILHSIYYQGLQRVPWSGRVFFNKTLPDNFSSAGMLMYGFTNSGKYFSNYFPLLSKDNEQAK